MQRSEFSPLCLFYSLFVSFLFLLNENVCFYVVVWFILTSIELSLCKGRLLNYHILCGYAFPEMYPTNTAINELHCNIKFITCKQTGKCKMGHGMYISNPRESGYKIKFAKLRWLQQTVITINKLWNCMIIMVGFAHKSFYYHLIPNCKNCKERDFDSCKQ